VGGGEGALTLSDLKSGHVFYAKAHPFAEFELFDSEGCVLHLKYAVDYTAEQQGGVVFRCQLDSEAWELQFFRLGWRQREFYRVTRNGSLLLATGVMKAWRWVDATFSDESVWQIRSGILRTTVRTFEGPHILRASRRFGIVLPRSIFRVERNTEPAKVVAVLIALLHFENRVRN
jgi:hypothetical protein